MKTRKFISLLMLIIMCLSVPLYSFAESETTDTPTGIKSVTATTDETPKPRRSCFNRGTATLTLVSDRNIFVQAQGFAYHNVDEIGISIYLQEMKNGITKDVKKWTVKDYNCDYTELNKTYTVDGNASYRLYGIFTTKHTADGTGTEGAAASTSWMWID